MSSLTNSEKRRLEKHLNMGGGYVLDFENRTYEEFFARKASPKPAEKTEIDAQE